MISMVPVDFGALRRPRLRYVLLLVFHIHLWLPTGTACTLERLEYPNEAPGWTNILKFGKEYIVEIYNSHSE